MNSGKAFHKTIENLLKELKENGQIGQTDSQILDEVNLRFPPIYATAILKKQKIF